MFHVKHQKKYSVHVRYIGSDGWEHMKGDNNHYLTRSSMFFWSDSAVAAEVAEEVFRHWRSKPYVQMVTYVHVWEVANDDNSASY